jgi:hypothetical protein
MIRGGLLGRCVVGLGEVHDCERCMIVNIRGSGLTLHHSPTPPTNQRVHQRSLDPIAVVGPSALIPPDGAVLERVGCAREEIGEELCGEEISEC